MLDLTFGPSFKVKRWFTGFGELSFWWIQSCIGSPMRRSSYICSPYIPGVIMSEGEIWKASKKLTLSALRDFGVGKATIEHKVLQEADNIVSEISKHNGKPFSFDLLFRKASANVVCAMMFGKRQVDPVTKSFQSSSIFQSSLSVCEICDSVQGTLHIIGKLPE